MKKLIINTFNQIFKKEKEEQKYIVDFGNQEYGVICTVGKRKDMYTTKSNPPGLMPPNKYTFDEIAETQFSEFDKLKKVS